jgi:selenocysteine lyase/cysteine desulfurase
VTIAPRLSIAEAAARFAVGAGYLDTASVGPPPDETWEAMRRGVDVWRAGTATPQAYDACVTASRASFARLVGVSADDVSVGSQVSVFAGFLAASLPDGAKVVAAEGDFTSILFPFMAQAGRGVDVVLVPLDDVADAIGPTTTLVSVSAVQSSNGRLADLDAIVQAADTHGAQTLIDGTQAVGWLPIDASRFDYFVCSAYKWLLSPRGTAFMTVRAELLDEIRPAAAGWYGGEDVWGSIYGGPLRLASSARRFDVSPAWLCWVGTVPSLTLIEAVGVEFIHAHNLGLANRLRAGLGLPPGDSAIACIQAADATEVLNNAGIRASARDGAARLAFHLYNSEADVDHVIETVRALRP